MNKQIILLITLFLCSFVISGVVSAANPTSLHDGNSIINLNIIKDQNHQLTFATTNTLKSQKNSVKTSNSKVYLIKLQSNRLNSQGDLVYDSFAIYQNPKNNLKWNRYLFNRMVESNNPGINGPEDVYRIYKLQNVNVLNPFPPYIRSSTTNVEDLTLPGNWEKAVQIGSNTTPLIGGIHGYEKSVSVKYYADSLQVTPRFGNEIGCNELRIVAVSNLYDPINPQNVIATTTCNYLWDGQELLLNTTYKWKISTNIYTAYAAMFPVKRSETVSTIGQIDGLPEENLTNNRTIVLRGDSDKGTTWNNINDLKLSLEVLNPLTALKNYEYNGNASSGETFFNNLGIYNKLYITRVHAPYFEEVINGTIWNIESRYKIWNDYTLPLTIISTDPSNNTVNIATNKIIKISFRRDIKPGIDYKKIVLTINGEIIPITKTINGNTLFINHPVLKTGTKYTLIIPENSTTDMARNGLIAYKLTFITDNTPPKIISTDPVLNAINVPVNNSIKVEFNEIIKFGNNSISLQNIRREYIPIKWTINGKYLTINTLNDLEINTKYRLLIHSSSITDISGNKLAKYYITTFTTTKPPLIKVIDPYNNQINVPINKVIKILFYEPIKFKTNFIELRSANGKTTSLKPYIIGKLLIINTSTLLNSGTRYTLILHKFCVTDMSGNGLTTYITNFTTVNIQQ